MCNICFWSLSLSHFHRRKCVTLKIGVSAESVILYLYGVKAITGRTLTTADFTFAYSSILSSFISMNR